MQANKEKKKKKEKKNWKGGLPNATVGIKYFWSCPPPTAPHPRPPFLSLPTSKYLSPESAFHALRLIAHDTLPRPVDRPFLFFFFWLEK